MRKGIFVAACGAIIAGLVLEFHKSVFAFILTTIDFIVQFFSWIWTSLFASYMISGVLILVLVVFAVFGVICFCVKLYKAFQSNTEPEFMKYVEDFIDGANWRWSWHKNRISNLWCFCPACDAQLVPAESIHETQFICERCPPDRSDFSYVPEWKIVATIKGGDRSYAIDAIEREIWRRIRTRGHPF